MKDTNIENWANIYKDTFVNEAGLSPLDIIKKGEVKKAEYDAEQKKAKDEKNKLTIASIWIRGFTEKNGKMYALLTIEYITGHGNESKVDDFEVTKTTEDKYYKKIARNLRTNRKTQGNKVHVRDEDVWLSMIRIAFADPRIKWYYGNNKGTDELWLFADETDDYENDTGYGSERFMEEYLGARMSGSSDPWADAEIACGIRDVSDFYDQYD